MLKTINENYLWAPGEGFLADPLFKLEENNTGSVPLYFYDISVKYFSILNCVQGEGLQYSFIRGICSTFVKRMLSKLTVLSIVLKSKEITADAFSTAMEVSLIRYADKQIEVIENLLNTNKHCLTCTQYTIKEEALVCVLGSTNKKGKCPAYLSTDNLEDLREDWKESLDRFKTFRDMYKKRMQVHKLGYVHMDNNTPWFYIDVLDILAKQGVPEMEFLKV